MKINIHRSATNRVLAGVIGGIAEHFNWNVNITRLVFVLLAITPMFPGIIAYLILWLLMKDPVQS
ncbi:PspC domain-containing protein [Lactiplantibacillus pentosus]|uniref:PspC domain-containing protein n=1 Tax=Lactiplantibacillus pentosus TaxID=1589 RepID=UPI001330AAF0|nr:PspC domain-containing protein [Lactiplantibacillus pentosus]MBQ0835561.1 PspC domain-containing protein [Lactiplantibacillus pentosus]MBU7464174.1 PspC domain-containing protein [Lactiplantibacillus pentosus]MBU7489527.1 PspC domain-containing protein [Lactiplantibacillus pentosus]MBU7492002.1 PspC domain-containing protein [Lactiplantibacillus pentosus]MBU7518144.1 PspC domain-containing protein [Lactiplantibacillus pentosus]